MSFAEFFKNAIIKSNISYRKLGERSGVDFTYISKMANGKMGPPSPEILKKLSPFLVVSYEELMEAAGYIENAYVDQPSIDYAAEQMDYSQQLDKRLRELLSDPDLRVAFYGLEDMTDEEKEGLITYLEGMKVRREKKGKKD